MNVPIRITALHMELNDIIKDYVHQKFQKLENHFSHIMDIHVTLSVERFNHAFQHKAKAHVILPKKHAIDAEEISPDMYASIDVLIDKLNRQLMEFKDKLKGE